MHTPSILQAVEVFGRADESAIAAALGTLPDDLVRAAQSASRLLEATANRLVSRRIAEQARSEAEALFATSCAEEPDSKKPRMATIFDRSDELVRVAAQLPGLNSACLESLDSVNKEVRSSRLDRLVSLINGSGHLSRSVCQYATSMMQGSASLPAKLAIHVLVKPLSCCLRRSTEHGATHEDIISLLEILSKKLYHSAAYHSGRYSDGPEHVLSVASPRNREPCAREMLSSEYCGCTACAVLESGPAMLCSSVLVVPSFYVHDVVAKCCFFMESTARLGPAFPNFCIAKSGVAALMVHELEEYAQDAIEAAEREDASEDDSLDLICDCRSIVSFLATVMMTSGGATTTLQQIAETIATQNKDYHDENPLRSQRPELAFADILTHSLTAMTELTGPDLFDDRFGILAYTLRDMCRLLRRLMMVMRDWDIAFMQPEALQTLVALAKFHRPDLPLENGRLVDARFIVFCLGRLSSAYKTRVREAGASDDDLHPLMGELRSYKQEMVTLKPSEMPEIPRPPLPECDFALILSSQPQSAFNLEQVCPRPRLKPTRCLLLGAPLAPPPGCPCDLSVGTTHSAHSPRCSLAPPCRLCSRSSRPWAMHRRLARRCARRRTRWHRTA